MDKTKKMDAFMTGSEDVVRIPVSALETNPVNLGMKVISS